MKIATVWMLVCLARIAPAQVPACLPVEKDHITAGDLSGVNDAFKTLPRETPLFLSPLPGVRRVVKPAEILQLAKKYSLSPDSAPEVCFAWEMSPLDGTRVVDAMRRSLGLADAVIEVVEMSHFPVPRGEIEFIPGNLGVPARMDRASPVLWRGNVKYGEGRRFAIWARVLLTGHGSRIVAVSPLRAGEPILASQIRTEATAGFPAIGKVLTTEQVLEMVPVRALPAGTAIRLADLSRAKDITAGQSVDVEVYAGITRLAFTGTAVSAGRLGESISIRNPETKKIFQAIVTGKGSAIVQLGGNRTN